MKTKINCAVLSMQKPGGYHSGNSISHVRRTGLKNVLWNHQISFLKCLQHHLKSHSLNWINIMKKKVQRKMIQVNKFYVYFFRFSEVICFTVRPYGQTQQEQHMPIKYANLKQSLSLRNYLRSKILKR